LSKYLLLKVKKWSIVEISQKSKELPKIRLDEEVNIRAEKP